MEIEEHSVQDLLVSPGPPGQHYLTGMCAECQEVFHRESFDLVLHLHEAGDVFDRLGARGELFDYLRREPGGEGREHVLSPHRERAEIPIHPE